MSNMSETPGSESVEPIETNAEVEPEAQADAQEPEENQGFDLGGLLYEATTRWLDSLEIVHILQNHEEFQCVLEELWKPHGGTLFLYNCNVNSSFETDGYQWCRTRIRPTDILKVVHDKSVRHKGTNPGLRRRCYSMWDGECKHIVLVHYRSVLKDEVSNTWRLVDHDKCCEHDLLIQWMKKHDEHKASHHHDVPEEWIRGEYLGGGSGGKVYRGFNRKNGKFCAIKEVKVIRHSRKSKDQLKQLKQEIDILTELEHPNIVQYYGSKLTADKLSTYIEYVPYGSIDVLLEEFGPLEEPVIRDYTAKILCGLTYLHEKSIVHRDIKGENILVSTDGEVKLADFGTAKHISSSSSSDIEFIRGTIDWTAPEVVKLEDYGTPVDIWSLACTVIEMATARIPWYQLEEDEVWSILEGDGNEIPEIPNSLSNEGKDFLNKCLKHDPDSRPTAAELMDDPFITNRPAL